MNDKTSVYHINDKCILGDYIANLLKINLIIRILKTKIT